ncbi:MAG: radical SAM protein [Candidatus Eremiobacteraeota bacterium]|nr:radical SAM protein [Candidatus Eremiobacteraeota bacterium]MBV8643938.1 radical SAM protein [Candidatus Eremiobacteraeota bacterium]
MFFRPRYLSILTTRQCTAACDHCCIGSSPQQRQAIPVQRIHELIDEATRIESIELIVFTGGECFLLGDALDELIGHATSNGFRTRAITNGYWAVNERAANARVASLRRMGLGELMFSTGTFHQRFVRVDRVIVGARTAAEAGILVRVSVETCDQATFDAAYVRETLADLIDARRVFVGEDPWTTDVAGRGDTLLTHERFFAHVPNPADQRCPQVLDVISVTPAQELIACCGFPQEHLPRMQLGSVAERPLDAVVATAPRDLLKLWLHVSGPVEIARFVAHYEPEFRLPRGASVCEVCAALQRDARAMRIIDEHAPQIERQIEAAFTQLRRQITEPSVPHLQLA